MRDELQALRRALALAPDRPSAEYPVRLAFQLPDAILISPGPHGFNVMVLPERVVRVRGRSTDHCFDLARAFFMAVAHERAGFTCHASITRDDDPKAYGRHMTVVRGALVVTGGTAEPRLYEVA
jgi:hypothetical protein